MGANNILVERSGEPLPLLSSMQSVSDIAIELRTVGMVNCRCAVTNALWAAARLPSSLYPYGLKALQLFCADMPS